MSADTICYVVTSKNSFWDFLNGYHCDAQSKDHFLRHLGYKFYKKCTMYDLNTAYQSGDIFIKKYNSIKNSKNIVDKNLIIEDAYFNEYGYVVEVSNGNQINPMIFVSDSEAKEWFESQK